MESDGARSPSQQSSSSSKAKDEKERTSPDEDFMTPATSNENGTFSSMTVKTDNLFQTVLHAPLDLDRSPNDHFHSAQLATCKLWHIVEYGPPPCGQWDEQTGHRAQKVARIAAPSKQESLDIGSSAEAQRGDRHDDKDVAERDDDKGDEIEKRQEHSRKRKRVAT